MMADRHIFRINRCGALQLAAAAGGSSEPWQPEVGDSDDEADGNSDPERSEIRECGGSYEGRDSTMAKVSALALVQVQAEAAPLNAAAAAAATLGRERHTPTRSWTSS